MFEPSAPIESILTTVAARESTSAGMRAMMQRETEFASPLAAKLTGIALDPAGRALADQMLDTYWADLPRTADIVNADATNREVIIGGGFHAAVYAAVRVRNGYPKPVVLERGERVGGVFAITARSAFHLNSRNRPGYAGLAGDQGADLNHLPGGLIQATNVSMSEYPTNADMAFVIRLALAQFADVVTRAEVMAVESSGGELEIDTADGDRLTTRRVIDARGVGDPVDWKVANGTTILTFEQFMQRMDTPWPLRGVRRAAIIGGGDSAKCCVESLLGIAPPPLLAAAALDHVARVDWYATDLPADCQAWQQQIRGRYQAVGRHLRPDRFGVRRLNIIGRRARPVALPDAALIDGRAYDLVVWCAGNRETAVDGLDFGLADQYDVDGGTTVARKLYDKPVFRVGPHARLPFTDQERQDGIADRAGNAVAMFRTASKTAALAASLPAVSA
jgi:hypothetical protein